MLDVTSKLPLKNPDLFREADLVGGQWVQAASSKTTAVPNPATGEVIGHVPAMPAVSSASRRRSRPG